MKKPVWILCVALHVLPAILSTIGGKSSADVAPPNATDAKSPPDSLAAQMRNFAGNVEHSVPPWVHERLLRASLSTECSLGLLRMLRGLSKLEPWALRSKLPSGLFTGTTTELGSFDECLATVLRDEAGVELVRAQYCSLYVKLGNDTSLIKLLEPAFVMTHPKASMLLRDSNNKWHPGLRWGICVIADCSQEDVQAVARALLGDQERITVRYCTTDAVPNLTTSQALVVAVLVTVLLLMVAGTIADVYAPDFIKGQATVCVLRSFSVPANLKLLGSTPESTSESYGLRFMHGIRAISIYYVVFGHTGSDFAFSTSGITFQLSYFDRYDSALSAVGFMAVDTFFFLSGYILSYSISGINDARGIKTVAVVAIRRWYRMVLPLVFVAACFSLLPLFVTGPTTSVVYDTFYENVRGHWWAFVLNIRNLYPELTHGPAAHTWYISADYQMFLAALIVHQLASRRSIVMALAALSLASSSYTAWQVYGTEYTPVIVHLNEKMSTYINMLTDVYMRPFYHAACYFGGCITFYAVQKYKDRKLSKGAVALLWAVAFGLGTACVAYRFEWTRGTKHSDLAKVSLALCDRSIWATALAALTFLCVTGRGGIVESMLSAVPLAVISKLSYGVYLIHFLFYFLSHNAARERKYTGVYTSFTESVSAFVWSCMLALVLFLACEAPVGRLDKIIWGQPTPKPKDEKSVNGVQDQELRPSHAQTKEAP